LISPFDRIFTGVCRATDQCRGRALEAEREAQDMARKIETLQEDLDTANATVASLNDTNEVVLLLQDDVFICGALRRFYCDAYKRRLCCAGHERQGGPRDSHGQAAT
jgi:hypothetical protein